MSHTYPIIRIVIYSVVGFSFDYTVYNLFGYLCYSTYQCALYFRPHIQDEYKHEHDTDDIGVKLNDVGMSIHHNTHNQRNTHNTHNTLTRFLIVNIHLSKCLRCMG